MKTFFPDQTKKSWQETFSAFLSYASQHFACSWSIHHPTSFCLKWEIWNPVPLFLLDIPWFAFLKMFQTAQASWMSRWVPERRITEKNSDTGYLAMFSLGQRFVHQNYSITMFSANIWVKARYNEPARRVRLGRGWVEFPCGSILSGEFGPSFPRKVVSNNKNGRASTAPSKRSDSVIRYNDLVDSNVLAGK